MEEVVVTRHPKHAKAFSRVIMMDIAKIIRNAPLTQIQNQHLYRRFADYFERLDQFFDRKTFCAVASGGQDVDNRTEPYTKLKE